MSNSEKVKKVKEVIKKHISDARCVIFSTRNIAGDCMHNIYDDGEVAIDICYFWEYFEVFGLTDEEFSEVEKYYEKLCGRA